MRRHGLTFVELMVASGVMLVLGAMVVQLQRSGWRRIESTDRKLTAARRTHDRLEDMRRTLASARWAWVVKRPGDEGPGSPLMYVGRSGKTTSVVELSFAPEERELAVNGQAVPGALASVRFESRQPHLVRIEVTTDEASAATGLAHRERSTLSTAVYLQVEAEDDEFGRFAYDEEHPWCTRGRALHAGFVDPPPPSPDVR